MTTVATHYVRSTFRRTVEEFATRVHRIADDQWSEPTPCADWDVRMLVHHLVEEQRWAQPLFAGATIADVGDRFAGDLLGADPVATFDEASCAALAAAEAPHALERTVHLSFGDVDGAEYAMQLAADHLIHAWDLAVAIGTDPTLDVEAVATVRAWFEPVEHLYRKAGLVGPRVTLPNGATPQQHLIAMFGRQS
jgi:uncharacterized protein (TIGR03086 family)